ncbi:PAS-domain containing protein [Rhodobacteraceae bacterium S2214]|nr:PAS-domain containing protein [Rhodobacteraceae bacterium S2214]
MESLGLLEVALIATISLGGTAAVALGFWFYCTLGLNHRYAGLDNIVPTFLFDGNELRDATPDAQMLIKDVPPHMNERESMLHILSARFPTLNTVMDRIGRNEVHTLTATDDSAISLEVTEIDGLIQVKLIGTCTQDSLTISAIAAQDAMLDELTMLRNIADKSPHMVWQQDSDGQLNWANQAYLDLCDLISDDQNKSVKSWPSEPAFPDLHHDMTADDHVSRRKSIDIPAKNGEAWFDITTFKNGNDALHFASNANKAVLAEQEKRKAVQMFGRIFAQLSTGLATFDANHRLTMFNPALIEMTNLAPEFLSSKPSMQMFLDSLREARLLPEPKDYVKWREQFPLNDSSTKRTAYCENWEIADGQTFKVIGQPARDGSYAFFFEDITAEISMTRRFRSDLETGQGVMDALPDAIAVFSANGTLVTTNKAYADLWDVDYDTTVRVHDLRAEMMMWQSHCAAAPIWGELRDFIGKSGHRKLWTDRAILDDGRQFTCKAQPIAGGKTMISFSVLSRMSPRVQQKLAMPDPAIYGLKG